MGKCIVRVILDAMHVWETAENGLRRQSQGATNRHDGANSYQLWLTPLARLSMAQQGLDTHAEVQTPRGHTSTRNRIIINTYDKGHGGGRAWDDYCSRATGGDGNVFLKCVFVRGL